jgi:hypothetical protein
LVVGKATIKEVGELPIFVFFLTDKKKRPALDASSNSVSSPEDIIVANVAESFAERALARLNTFRRKKVFCVSLLFG